MIEYWRPSAPFDLPTSISWSMKSQTDLFVLRKVGRTVRSGPPSLMRPPSVQDRRVCAHSLARWHALCPHLTVFPRSPGPNIRFRHRSAVARLRRGHSRGSRHAAGWHGRLATRRDGVRPTARRRTRVGESMRCKRHARHRRRADVRPERQFPHLPQPFGHQGCVQVLPVLERMLIDAQKSSTSTPIRSCASSGKMRTIASCNLRSSRA